MSRSFPDHPMLRGLWEPWPMEGSIHDLPVSGEIPRELAGTLYRNGPNPQFAPRGAYHFFGGDGMVHALRIEDGRCHYRNRWVRTPRFELEREAGEALYSSFAGPGEDDPRTEGVPGGPANTNVVWHAGRLLALVEGGLPPVELDPETLETRGLYEFGGSLPRGTFTAHPKLDPESKEMLGFDYSPFAPYILYHVVGADGRLVRSVPIEAPYPSMVHDFITTRDHVIFPVFPATLRVERAAQGESVLGWEPELGTQVGVMPRDGSTSDVVWLQTDPCYVFHPLNAHSEGQRVICEMAQYARCPVAGAGTDGAEGLSNPARLVRWTLDLDAGTVKQEPLDDRMLEFPRLDERFTGLAYRHGYAAGAGDRALEGGSVIGTNALLHYDVRTGACRRHELGAQAVAGEPIFVPRRDDAPEGDGYLLALVYRTERDRSDLVILDAQNVDRAPLARVHLPHRVPGGFHGNWRPAP
jgi:carotenoid cleavage dioxygenase